MDFFTSDTHFAHANCIKYSKRPFASIDEMDDALIANINKVVKPNDRLFHLGDFAMRNVLLYRQRIRCKNIVLIKGNHDKDGEALTAAFSNVYDMLHLKIDLNGVPKTIVLCHYAMKVWNKSHYGSYHLFGHSHGGLPDDETELAFDVGVDCHNYRPISLDEVIAIMAKKKWEDPHLKWEREGVLWKPFDHHPIEKPKETDGEG